MYYVKLNNFKTYAINKLDEEILLKCGIKLRHPEYLLDVLLDLCEKYYQLEEEDKI